jgi:hypothetical protein|tara:strand:+ start:1210 stop:1455 length:246 start_codon:yes stop_codon:yes gene_type:complete
MQTLVVWFVSALIISPIPQKTGWIQFTKSYSTLEHCQLHIKTHKPDIIYSLMKYTGGGVEIKDIKCMTYKEAVKKNTELGH